VVREKDGEAPRDGPRGAGKPMTTRLIRRVYALSLVPLFSHPLSDEVLAKAAIAAV